MNEKFSKIRINVVNGTKQYLKDVDSPQAQWVKIEVTHPENGRVFEVEMSMIQFSQMLVTNSEVSCTIKSMYDKNGNLIKEVAEKPKTAKETLSENLQKNQENITKRFEDLTEDINQMIESKSISKKKLKEALHDLKVISSHHASNNNFFLEEAKAKVEEINNDKKIQILNLIGQGHKAENFVKMISHDDTPLIEEYQGKENKETNIDEMNKRELARELNNLLKSEKFKNEELFEPNAQDVKDGVSIVYVSYQGSTTITVEEARTYLKKLKKAKTFKRHFGLI